MDKDRLTHKLIGYVSMTSGQLLVIDPSDLDRWESGQFDDDSSTFPTMGYSEACKIINQEQGYGSIFLKKALTFKTDSKDGLYPVHATLDHEGRIIKIEIEFVQQKKA